LAYLLAGLRVIGQTKVRSALQVPEKVFGGLVMLCRPFANVAGKQTCSKGNVWPGDGGQVEDGSSKSRKVQILCGCMFLICSRDWLE